MNIKLNQISLSEQVKKNDLNFLMMSFLLIGLNLTLMGFISLYWLNADFHTFIAGSPL